METCESVEAAQKYIRSALDGLKKLNLEGDDRKIPEALMSALCHLAPDHEFEKEGVVRIKSGDEEGIFTTIKDLHYDGFGWVYEVTWLGHEYKEAELEIFYCCRGTWKVELERTSDKLVWVYYWDKTGNKETHDVVTHCRYCNKKFPEVL